MNVPSSCSPARVLHVVTSTHRRGAQTYAVGLHESLRRRGWTSSIVALDGGGDLPVDWVGRGRFKLTTLAELVRRSRRADVVVAHGSSTLLAMFLTTRLTRVPYVYRSIGDPDHWVSGRLRALRVGTSLRRAAAVVTLWPEAAARLSGRYRLAASRVVTIPNAVVTTAFAPVTAMDRRQARSALDLHPSARIVCFVGSLSAEKNPYAAVDAVARCPRDVLLLVAGDGPLRDETVALADRLLLRRHRFLGAVRDVRTVLAASDVLLLPSDTEGVPAALIEAGLMGLPVVATDVGGVGTVVDDGFTGVLVPAHDREALASSLMIALRRAPVLGRAAAAKCREEFDMERSADAWSRLLRAVAPAGADRTRHALEHSKR